MKWTVKNCLKTIDMIENREKHSICQLTTKENKDLAILLFCETANISASERFCDQCVYKLLQTYILMLSVEYDT